ncbi:ABC transporter ATP-binding protein [Tenuibacillus multivorans]|uniref:ATP-binding cassette, subfamily B n=1 Tax=Tenuibacillus multivorans TaxID=237069 RepID=A0A1H0EVU3_9BACI|nr:ABC transporter ATP-binding protein [Tenuibacillus multivorans]GEL76937.1 multidrug ABC transporter permease/ATP-binding protein [Tenuibacillus multivorans]SDN86490.1 ATP-binding cassette, subfamily B [Tenuibacillus multivorans]
MISVFRKLSWYFKEQWVRYTLAVTALIIANVLVVIPPMVIGEVIDAIQYNTLTADRFKDLIVFLIGLVILYYFISFFWDYTLFGRAILLERKMRSKLMNHFMFMTPSFFSRYRTGDLMARATNDLKAIMVTAGFGILTLVDATVFMFFIVAIMFVTINWKLTLAALIPLPIMAITMQKYGRAIHERFMKAQSSFSDLNNDTLESIQGVRVIRAFVQENQDEARFNDKTEVVFQKNIAVAKLDALFEPTIKTLVGLAYTIGLGYGSYLVIRGEITIGQLVSFNVYLGMLIWPMFAVGELINVMQRGNASLDRTDEILSHQSDVKDPKQPKDIKQPTHIQFDQLSFKYPSVDQYDLKAIDLDIKSGETIGVVGMTGSGKTTLFRQLLREYPPAEKGRLLINGVPIQELALERTRNWIGYVPQDHILFSKTVRENILFGHVKASYQTIYRILETASLLEDIENLPDGLDTLVGESGVTLSGGQKQRVSLARALIKDPEILILDDSLSAVDGQTESKIIEHLKRERANKTTFIAAHRLSAVKHADQIIVLDNGDVVEHGSHEDLMRLRGWYYSQFNIQQMEGGE